MKTTTINVPDGFEFEKIENGQVFFKEVKKPLPKSWDEFCESFKTKEDEIYLIDGGLQCCKIGIETERGVAYGRNFKNEAYAKADIALRKLTFLRDLYRDGWVPNWRDESELKHVIKLYEDCIKKDSYILHSFFLSFETAEIRDEFLENFRDIILEAKLLLS